MNGKSASDIFLFEAGGWKMILLARDAEYVGGSDHSFDLVKVIRVISGNVKQASGNEGAMNEGHEFGGESTPPVMSPFWPRIGE
jgi:hypothetical protein